MNSPILSPRPDVVLDDATLTVTRAGAVLLRLALGGVGGATRAATLLALDEAAPRAAFFHALDALFAADASLAALDVDAADFPGAAPALERHGLAWPEGGGRLRFSREAFVQQPAFWLTGDGGGGFPLSYRISDGRRHPLRPKKPAGTVYRRDIPWLGAR